MEEQFKSYVQTGKIAKKKKNKNKNKNNEIITSDNLFAHLVQYDSLIKYIKFTYHGR